MPDPDTEQATDVGETLKQLATRLAQQVLPSGATRATTTFRRVSLGGGKIADVDLDIEITYEPLGRRNA